jgi:hypothetical protein
LQSAEWRLAEWHRNASRPTSGGEESKSVQAGQQG